MSRDDRILMWACFGCIFALLGSVAAMFYQIDTSTVLLTAACGCAIAMMTEIVFQVIR